ncbi:MAG: M14 family zinc carboxypeptidase [Ignavibacteriales bacterium]|nr:M14 family zinc carboxypeptidase [Ignavibacteriales bacterium]
MKKACLYFFILIAITQFYNLHAQERNIIDPCGFPDTSDFSFQLKALGNWGYGYDSLKADLNRWGKRPFVKIDSIGATVQSRTMFMLTIQDTSATATPRKRIWIHARTHPNEVQGTWVTNEIIKFLLSDSLLGKRLLDSCVFNIVPMYNPDGVELGKGRENANGIDIESNWDKNPSQAEVQVLRNTFIKLMAQPNPILVALNMHSSYSCERYFVFHDSTGTTNEFARQQRKFINLVRNYSPNNFQTWDYLVSWVGTPSTKYPESWFWQNHREKVLALTYEDMNCTENGKYNITAVAILNGIANYLEVGNVNVGVFASNLKAESFQLSQNYPNPFNSITNIQFHINSESIVSFRIYDILGREVALLINDRMNPGSYQVKWDAGTLASGIYFCKMNAGEFTRTIKLILNK